MGDADDLTAAFVFVERVRQPIPVCKELVELAPRAAELLDRRPSRRAWPAARLWTVVGWTLAPIHLLGLTVA